MSQKIFILFVCFICSVNFNINSAGIWDSASEGNLEQVIKFIEKIGVDIDTKDKEGNTPLYYAVKNGQVEIVKYLISKKANINIKNNENEISVIELVLPKYFFGGGKYIPKNGYTIAKLLFENGADITAKTSYMNYNLLNLALSGYNNSSDSADSAKIARLIWEKNKSLPDKIKLKIK